MFNLAQVCSGGKRKKDEISVDCLDFNKKILHTAWHPQVPFRPEVSHKNMLSSSGRHFLKKIPQENIIAVAATNNLFLFQVTLMIFH